MKFGITSKFVERPNHDILEIYPWLRSLTCTLRVCQICLVESCTIVILSCGENLIQFEHASLNIYGLQTRMVTHVVVLHLTQIRQLIIPPPKRSVPNSKRSMRVSNIDFIYVILTHVIVGNTLNQYIPSVNVISTRWVADPMRTLCGNPFWVVWAFKS